MLKLREKQPDTLNFENVRIRMNGLNGFVWIILHKAHLCTPDHWDFKERTVNRLLERNRAATQEKGHSDSA